METILSPKRRFKLHRAKSKKTSLIDTAVKALRQTVVFQHSFWGSHLEQ
jgi:hypothetical protein